VTTWDELVTTALVGTARRPPALPEGPRGTALGDVLAAIDRSDPEAAVLRAGAVLGLYRQAGWRPPADAGPPLPVCPEDTQRRCSQAAASRLGSILGGQYRVVLVEWLGLVAAVHHVVPPDRLPPLLDVASSNAVLRQAVAAVIGERGRWLAGLNPGWAWATAGGEAPQETAIWATGTPRARRLLLARLRATDPAAARELLASTWSTETAEDRAAFVAALATGLSLDDEPFLEAALDDRRKEVRVAAAGLLARLPESRLAHRMAERSRPLVRVAGERVEATFPDHVDPAMVRDGVVAKAPAGLGARAWWCFQLVAATPLQTWVDALGRPAARLVEAADPVLRQAWAAAAAAQNDEEWALALLATEDVDQPALVGAVPSDRAVAVALDRVTRLGLTPGVVAMLDHVPVPWGPELSGAVVHRLGVAVTRQRRPDKDAQVLRARVADLAARLDPTVAPDAAVQLADATGWWSDVVSWFLDLLTFRAEMREELAL
jgi:hypothetical protein